MIKRLSTSELWEAALIAEKLGEKYITSCWFDDKGAALIAVLGNEPVKEKGFKASADYWEIQPHECLAPTPRVGDLVTFLYEKNSMFVRVLEEHDSSQNNTVAIGYFTPERMERITNLKIYERLYPDETFAPFVELRGNRK
jgi:hypothetical protein